MEDKKIDLQVGDRVTYINNHNNKVIEIIAINWRTEVMKESKEYRILKIERIGTNGWYTVYERKELLTEEEKEFLNDIIKHFSIELINFGDRSVVFYGNGRVINCPDYPSNLKFEGIERYKDYTLKELGLE